MKTETLLKVINSSDSSKATASVSNAKGIPNDGRALGIGAWVILRPWSLVLGHSFVAVALLLSSARPAFAADPLSETLQKGLFDEEANHNLEAAIKAYQSVIEQSEEQRRITATAVFRLGECYRKLNKTNEAAGYYQRLLRDFSDQSTLVALSQQNLAALGLAKGKNLVGSAPPDGEEAEVRSIQRMIKDSPDLINARQSPGNTPLHDAAAQGKMKVARFLLSNGAQVNARDNRDATPLHYAAVKGQRAMCELLLTNGAEPDAVGSYTVNGTPLHMAVQNGYQAVTETLLQHKANPNLRDNFGETPLHIAAKRGPATLVQLLIQHGADPNVADNHQNLPIHEAADVGSVPITKLLIEAKSNLGQKGRYGYLPFHSGIKPGNAGVVRLLLQAGSDVNARSDGGWTAVHLAARDKADDVLSALFEFKPNLEAQTDASRTPLLTALEAKAPGAVELLLKAGANPNAQDGRSGDFPLLFAIRMGQTQIVRLLLAHKADPNVIHPDGSTALGLVRAYLTSGQQSAAPEIHALLIKHGADQNIDRRRHISLFREDSNREPWNFVTKDRHGDRQYTLLEVLGFYYQGRSPGSGSRSSESTWQPYPFPDLARITIERLVDGGKATNRIPVALDENFVDVPLQWGDIVFVPEADHHLSMAWSGFPNATAMAFQERALKTVTIHAKTPVAVKIRPELVTDLRQQSGLPVRRDDDAVILNWPTLQYVVHKSGVLRASSDITRVKVTRREDDRKQSRILFFNLDKAQDLWLQDSDVIEIPDKES